MDSARPVISNAKARRIFLSAHGLLSRPTGAASYADVAQTVHNLGFVQVDSINTVARAHDHILWSRLPSYRPGRAMGCAARDRSVFEGWTHDAALIPAAFFPHWRHKFDADRKILAERWVKWGREGFEKEFQHVLKRIEQEGALSATDLGEGERQNGGGWWDWKPRKAALEYLWRSGDLAICHRKSFSKFYELTERVIPPEHLNARTSYDESLDWSARAALDRLGFASPSELSAFWDLFPKKALANWAKEPQEALVWVDIELNNGSLKPVLTHADWEARLEALPEPTPRLRILSPFDPALRDRKRAERLFGFEYRIEVFVPEPKRQYGYYVFPILEGEKLTGRIDVKADRATDTLLVKGYWPEKGISLGTGRARRLAQELIRIARLAKVTKIEFENTDKTALLRKSREF
ncbi:MAG: winged helix DNA-binding domain-containing protein [Rhodobacteraceae bacterium]|nr:winged helix DNA-binding domain-containing protein [Paracoccaceae bacterium]